MKNKLKQRVICAMSGGIDSSVAAFLLKKAGFETIGVFMKFWSEKNKAQPNSVNRCCSPSAERSARKIAAFLKIPFYVFNLRDQFKKKVVDYFLDEYKKGKTPNPCVVCNKEIKFGLLLEKAFSLGADLIATGHYARLASQNQKIKLFRAKDKTKDQTYFLWQLNQKQLNHILFPLENYTKTEVRKIAKKFKLPVSEMKESQEICFIQGPLNNFLKQHLRSKPGRILNFQGQTIGRHKSLYFYTIGQRKNLELPQGPWYVQRKNLKKNLLIVTKTRNNLYKKEMIVKKVHWISNKKPCLPLKVKVKIRYNAPLASALLAKQTSKKEYKIIFNKAQKAITPGQSAVFYSSQTLTFLSCFSKKENKAREVLGGGIIKS